MKPSVPIPSPSALSPLWRVVWVVTVTLLMSLGCSRRDAKAPDLPPPERATSIGVGDTFELQIVGEDELPKEYTVAPDGTVDFPYIHRQEVDGLEPQEISALVREQLQQQEILTDPSVTVRITQYNSKRIEVLGQVAKPGSFPLEPGMTLLRAISLAGGFNALADKDSITIRRKVDGGIKAAKVSVDDIMDNRIADVPLQAGDSINVDERVF